MSHDLKTPVARIQGNAELLASAHAAALSEGQKKSVDAILNTTEDLSRYVETVLDLTRVESSEIPLQKVSKDINTIIEEIIRSKEQLCQEKDITLKAELEPLFSFKFDAKLIREVLVNLVENAIKYSPKGSHITLSSREDGSWVRVSVTDEGAGIASEDKEKIFEKFYRCQNQATKAEKGTGLGLYLVKYFVELHDGLVEVSSELGKGSTFTVSLPA